MDLPRAARLRITGNGVVPQCASLAFRILAGQLEHTEGIGFSRPIDGARPERGGQLREQADNWPTPDTQNTRGGQAMRSEAKGKHAMSLHHVVEGWE